MSDDKFQTTDPTPTQRQAAAIAAGGNGCCHKTRLKGSGCPIGWKCPHIKEAEAHD